MISLFLFMNGLSTSNFCMCLIQEHLPHHYTDKFHLRDGPVRHNCHICCASFLMITVWEGRCVSGNKKRINFLLMRVPWINICSKKIPLAKLLTEKKMYNLVHIVFEESKYQLRVWRGNIKCKDMTKIIGVKCNVQHTWLFISCSLQMLTAEAQCSLSWEENSFQILLGIGNFIQRVCSV